MQFVSTTGNRFPRFCALLAGAAISAWLFTPLPLAAVVLAYEGFDYQTGTSVVGQAGGLNFANAWQLNGSGAGSIYTNVAGSLGYTDSLGNVLVTTGNHGYFAGSFSANNTAQPNRDFNFTRTSGTTWISFIGVREGITTNTLPANPYPRGANLAFFNVGSERIAVGNATGAATNAWSILPANTATQLRQSTTPFSEQVFIVLRIDHLGDTNAADNAYLFINPVLGVEPDIGAANTNVLGFTDHSFNRIRPFAGGYNTGGTPPGQPNAQLRLDEIRIGETYADVTPIVPVNNEPPGLTVDLTNQVAQLCGSASFFINATGSPPLHYQWFFQGAPAGGNSNSLTVANLSSGQTGPCFVIVTNTHGAATSAVVTLTLVDTAGPVITQCATNQSVATGTPPVAMPNLVPQIVATDCSGIASITQNPPAGTLVGLGTHPVTLSVTDNSNNVSQCQATVTVTGNVPEIVYPSTFEITNSGAAVLLEDYAALPLSGRGGSLTNFNPAPIMTDQLARPTFLRSEPTNAPLAATRFFVTDLNRNLYILDKTTRTFTAYINFQSVFPKYFNSSGFAGGLNPIAFDPGYATNGIFYTAHLENPGVAGSAAAINTNLPTLNLTGYSTTAAVNPPTGSVTRESVLLEWADTNVNNATFEGTLREILRVGLNSQIHPMGDLLFNPLAQPGHVDYRNLYIAQGDGSAGENSATRTTPQRLDALQGKILRITPDLSLRPGDELSANGRYRIPTTGSDPNPFVSLGLAGLRKEIFAYGFRNCHRISWDPVSNLILENDIGLHSWEEVNIVQKGVNYGYSEREGPEQLFVGGLNNGRTGSQIGAPFPANDTLSVNGLASPVVPVYPVAQYSHWDGDGISSGVLYRGALMPEMQGKYIFGDIANGRVFYSDFSEMLAAHDGDRNTVAPVYELQLVYNQPNDSPDVGWSRWRMFDIVAVTYTNRGGNPGIQRLPGTAESTGPGKTDINGVPYGRGRTDLRLTVGDDGEIYVISKSDGMIRRMTAALHPPNIQSITNSASDVTITWRSVPGWTYRVQYKTNLSEVDWLDLPGDVTAAGLSTSRTITVDADCRLFRVKRQP